MLDLTSTGESCRIAAQCRTSSVGFLLERREEQCAFCLRCVRQCPARAIKMSKGDAEIIESRCVKCGACVSDCGNRGFMVRDDLPRVRELLLSEAKVVALLATEYVAALHPRLPSEVEWLLHSAGFFGVETTTLGEEMVAEEYERLHTRSTGAFSLRATCPVVVDWVRKYHPGMVGALAPIVPPYIAQARLIKEMYPEGMAVVYVSPCYARKDEVFDSQFEGAVDVAIDFTELERLLSDVQMTARPSGLNRSGPRRSIPDKQMSLTDGFPRETVLNRDSGGGMVVVRGLNELDELLFAIAAGETAPAIVDMLNCDGCIDGPAVRPDLTVYAKRNIMLADKESVQPAPVQNRELLRNLPSVELRRKHQPQPVFEAPLTAEKVDAELSNGGFASREDVLDCGACGYSTCVEHAIAVLRGNSNWELCFPQQHKRYLRLVTAMELACSTDTLTGLGNRSLFNERLAEEISRARRYGYPLSVLMIDIDGFKQFNDTYGHRGGDAVLKACADAMAAETRDSDLLVRYGGDEFALLLPMTTKTAAFAVAEKLRGAVSETKVDYTGALSGGGDDVPAISVSVGVAALSGDGRSETDLLESADQALYEAKKSGKNQVKIAPD